ncbi:juvenile hormone acid O-methyltransferase isoform X2 [Lingula anatina]|nr:juvenile hormone acid O-methyltransferase isoform X2 [Lingula anatina]|eukprot:XP_013383203.1 juvenile hormone acid O-methyltransferase isoform X2 [Lingula anatina]
MPTEMKWDAQKFSSNFSNRRGLIENALMEYPLNWKSGDCIIDIGSGTGDVTKHLLLNLSPYISEVVGVDCSQDMVQFATENSGDPRISYAVANIAEKSTLKPEWISRFDKLFSFYTMHWIRDQVQTLRNMNSILKVGAEIFLFFTASHYKELQYASTKITLDPEWKEYFMNFDPQILYLNPSWQAENLWWSSSDQAKGYADIVQQCGFDVVKANVHPVCTQYGSEERLKEVLSGWIPHMASVPKEKKASFMNRFFQYLKEAGLQTEWKNLILCVHAIKISEVS